jgi:hypothetical protein
LKIQFDAVHLDHPVDRLGGVGMAYANTQFFSHSKGGYNIELDTDTDLVTVQNQGRTAAIVVPIQRVMRFEPLRTPPPEAPAKTKGK